MDEIKTPKQERLLELDVLRGLAALSVLAYHFTHRYGMIYKHEPGLWMNFRHAHYGVELFFMISGFVILMTLDKTRRGLDFIVGRFSRLYPVFWTTLAITFTLVSLVGLPGREASFSDALANLSMVRGSFKFRYVDGVYWTLERELFFYVVMLALYWLKGLRWIGPIVIAWIGLSFVQYDIASFFGIQKTLFYAWLKLILNTKYIHLFALGIAFYCIHRRKPSVLNYVILLLAYTKQWVDHSWQTTLMLVVFSVPFVFIGRPWMKKLSWRPLVYLGGISYSLYLVHQNIGYVVIRQMYRITDNPQLAIAVALVAVLSLAALIHHAVEKPSIRLIRSWYGRWKKDDPPVDASSTPRLETENHALPDTE